MELYHQPGEIPNLSGRGVGPVEKKEVTKPQPFKFTTDKRPDRPRFDFNKENEPVRRADEQFMKKALRGHHVNPVESKPVTVCIEPSNHLSKRGEERKQYDMQQEEARKLAAEEQAKRDEEKAAQEAEEIQRLRATTLIHKPEPITKYKPVAEMKRKQLTQVSFESKLSIFHVGMNFNFSQKHRTLPEHKIDNRGSRADYETKGQNKISTHIYSPSLIPVNSLQHESYIYSIWISAWSVSRLLDDMKLAKMVENNRHCMLLAI